jgi:hypothetical protein
VTECPLKYSFSRLMGSNVFFDGCHLIEPVLQLMHLFLERISEFHDFIFMGDRLDARWDWSNLAFTWNDFLSLGIANGWFVLIDTFIQY